MWAPQVDLIAAFCVSAVVVFLASLGLMMLVVYLRRPKPDSLQSQGQPCNIVYVPTTVQSAGNTEVAKPLLIGFEKVNGEVNGIYPSEDLRKELTEALKEPLKSNY